MDEIKLAVVGGGVIGKKHMRFGAWVPNCRMVAICDPDPSQAEFAREQGAAFHTDVGAMIEAEGIQGAIISTPSALHVDVAIQCMERGVHVIVEKPIAETVAEGKQLMAAAKANGVHIMTGHYRRFNHQVEAAREIVQGGEIGRLVAVNGIWAMMKHPAYFDVAWRRQAGAGPVLTNMIHDIDCLRYICGEIVSVYAETSNATRGFQIEDTAAIILRFENGALGTFALTDTVPSPWAYEADTAENADFFHVDENCYHIMGQAGSLGFPKNQLWGYAEGAEIGWHLPMIMQNRPQAHGDPLQRQIEHFCEVIRGNTTPRCDGREGTATLAVTAAIFESAREGKMIEVEKV